MKKLLSLLVFASLVFTGYSQNRVTQPAALINAETISINVPADTIDNTVIRKKATLFTMIYNQSAKTLSLTWTVRHYADSLGYYGNDISDIIPDYSITSVADNETKVNPSTGAIIEGTPTISWIGQYDFFNYLARYQPLLVHDVIKQYGMAVSNWKKRN